MKIFDKIKEIVKRSNKHKHEWLIIGFTKQCIKCKEKQHFIENEVTKKYEWIIRKDRYNNEKND